MTHDLLKVINLHTNRARLYVDGKRVSQATFDTYRSIGCFFTESTNTLRRFFAVGVKR